MDPIGLIFIGLTFLLILAAIIVPQMQKRNEEQ